MRELVAFALFLWASAASAQVVITRWQGARPETPVVAGAWEKRSLDSSAGDELTEPQDQLLIPTYLVDTSDPGGRTTLLAIRNQAGEDQEITAAIEFFALDGVEHAAAQLVETLAPREVRTFNLRDIEGLPADDDGFKRGLILVTANGPMISDSFQVNPGEDFATGNLAFAFPEDLCRTWVTRFVNFGGPEDDSVITFFANIALGAPDNAPPTFLGTAFDEAGEEVGGFEIRTGQLVFETSVRDLVPEGVRFGALEIGINSYERGGGFVSVEHRAQGRFAVGTKAVCTDLPVAPAK